MDLRHFRSSERKESAEAASKKASKEAANSASAREEDGAFNLSRLVVVMRRLDIEWTPSKCKDIIRQVNGRLSCETALAEIADRIW